MNNDTQAVGYLAGFSRGYQPCGGALRKEDQLYGYAVCGEERGYADGRQHRSKGDKRRIWRKISRPCHIAIFQTSSKSNTVEMAYQRGNRQYPGSHDRVHRRKHLRCNGSIKVDSGR